MVENTIDMSLVLASRGENAMHDNSENPEAACHYVLFKLIVPEHLEIKSYKKVYAATVGFLGQ